MNVRIKVIILFSLITNTLYSQSDPQYSHFMFNNFAVNPGAAGISGKINATVISRNQWIGIDGQPKTNYLGVDALIKLFGIKSGVGLNISRDEIGFEKDLSINASYAYIREIGTGKLAIGAQFGVINKALDPAWRSFDDNGTDTQGKGDVAVPLKGQDDLSKVALDLGIGAYYRTSRLTLSLSAIHLNQPKFKFANADAPIIKRHYFFNATYLLPTNLSQIDIQPSIQIKMTGPVLQYDFNTIAYYNKKFWGGITYRWGDAFLALAGLEMINGIRLGIAYEVTTSKLRKVSKNTTEIYVNYSFDLSGKRTKQKFKTIRYQ